MKNKINNKLFNIVSEIYIVLIFLGLMCCMNSNGYYSILECKYSFFVLFSSIYIISILGIYIYKLIIKRENYLKNYKLSWIQIIAIIFFVIIMLSCAFSPYLKTTNLIIGKFRYEGLLLYFLYTSSFLLLTFFLKFNKRFYSYIIISCFLLSSIATIQHFGINIFKFYHTNIGLKNGSFLTFIGNIDTVSAVLTLLLPVVIGDFIFNNNNIIKKIIRYIVVFLSSYMFFFINVKSGQVAFLILFLLFFPSFISNEKNFKNFLLLCSSIFNAYCLYSVNYIFLFIGILLILLPKYIKLKYELNKKIYNYYYLCLICISTLFLLFIYFYNFKSGILYEFHELMHLNFNDKFGTYRIFIWKRTIPLIKNYPIIGSGPDTFGIRFMELYTKDIISLGDYSINDSAMNAYLTLIINYGFCGLITYLILIFLIIKKLLKNKSKKNLIFLMSVICFLIQDFFNIWVVIVIPYYICILAISINEE